MNDEYFMKEAIKQAKIAAEEGEVPVGAVVVYNGEIIATGRNRRETAKNALAHAEIEAINNACIARGGWRLFDCTLYVTLEPCVMCSGAIVNSRIDRVVYGGYDKRFGGMGSATDITLIPQNHVPKVTKGVLCEECTQLLQDFFSKLRNK